MSKNKRLKHYTKLDLNDKKNDNIIKSVYRSWALSYDYDNYNKLGTVSQPKSVKLLLSHVKDRDLKT